MTQLIFMLQQTHWRWTNGSDGVQERCSVRCVGTRCSVLVLADKSAESAQKVYTFTMKVSCEVEVTKLVFGNIQPLDTKATSILR